MFSTAEIMDSYVKTLEQKGELIYRPPAWSRQLNGISMMGFVASESESNRKNIEMEKIKGKED